MKTKRYLLMLLLTAGFYPVFPQAFIANKVGMADQAFEEKNYYTAAIYYERFLNEMGDDQAAAGDISFPYEMSISEDPQAQDLKTYAYVVDRLALSYRLYYDYEEAEKWYAQSTALKNDSDPETLYWYGVMLRANGKLEEAVVQFDKILDDKNKLYGNEAEFQKKNCLYALNQMEYPGLTTVEPYSNVNVEQKEVSDYAYAEAPDEGGFLFTTTRYRYAGGNADPNAYKNTLMLSRDGNMEALGLPVGENMNVAAASLTADGNTLFLNVWAKPESVNAPVQHKIHVSFKDEEGNWSAPVPLGNEVNMEGSSSLYPFISEDGTELFFASDRTGGYGGLDLYRVPVNDRGLATGEVVNLGETINTSLDEVTPFFDGQRQILYFSSEGKTGLGGLDVFKSERRGSEWREAQNLGYPVNSGKDDAYAYMQDDKTGVLSSDRRKSCCYELFSFTIRDLHGKGLVTDAGNGQPLDDVKIVMRDSLTNEILDTGLAIAGGSYVFRITPGRSYVLDAEKEGFLSTSVSYRSPAREDVEEDTLYFPPMELIPLRVGEGIVLNNIFYDFNSANLRPESRYELSKIAKELKKHPELLVEIGSHTDSVGSNEYNLDLSQRRSESVVNFMLEQGVERGKIIPKGYGETQPLRPNSNPDGSDNPDNRQLNRRTEFKILDMNGSVKYDTSEALLETGEPLKAEGIKSVSFRENGPED